jgi:hypothetical protein
MLYVPEAFLYKRYGGRIHVLHALYCEGLLIWLLLYKHEEVCAVNSLLLGVLTILSKEGMEQISSCIPNVFTKCYNPRKYCPPF